MYSKWKIWDFFSAKKFSLSLENKGVHVFKIFEPVVTKYIREGVSPEIKNEQFRVQVAQELTRGELENLFCGLSLFGNSESLIVLGSEKLSSDVQDFILENPSVFQDGFLVLIFEETSSFFKKLSQMDEFFVNEMEAPFFWEYNKLLDYLSERKKITLSYDAKNYLTETIIPSALEYELALDSLIINFSRIQNFELQHVQAVLKKTRVDQFQLATLLGEKKKKELYHELLSNEQSFDEFRQLFSFFQGHLVKLRDPSYTQKKKRISKYDKEILSLSSKWSPEQIKEMIILFGNWEILSKKKDEHLTQLIRQEYYKECFPLSV